MPGADPIVLSDTVGFIRDLPHDLVAAFRATLAEAADADLLLHVVDASHPNRDEQIAAVDAVLAEIGADRVPQIRVFNKIDAAGACAGRRARRVWYNRRGSFERPDRRRLHRIALARLPSAFPRRHTARHAQAAPV